MVGKGPLAASKLVIRILFLVALVFGVLTWSCSKNGTGGDGLVTFSGKVTLEGETDHSGVTVMLFKPVEIDTALTNLNQRYPGIGVEINQRTEFDHRNEKAAYSTTTDAGGKWKIENVTPGVYHVVAEKEGFAWEYALEVSANQVPDLTLKPLLTLSRGTDMTSHGRYRIDENTAVTINLASSLSDVRILLGRNTKLSLNLTGNVELNQFEIRGEAGSTLEILNSDNQIVFQAGMINGLGKLNVGNVSRIQFTDCLFRHTNNIVFQSVNTLLFSQVFLEGGDNISLFNCASISILKSIFYRINQYALDISNSGGAIEDCLFKKNRTALFSRESNAITIQYNEFRFNDLSIWLNNNYEGTIRNCVFSGGQDDIKLLANYGNPRPSINQNNFLQTDGFAIHMGNKPDSLDATNNYWGTTDIAQIEEKIFDFHDNANLGEVIIQPFLVSKNESAGVR